MFRQFFLGSFLGIAVLIMGGVFFFVAQDHAKRADELATLGAAHEARMKDIAANETALATAVKAHAKRAEELATLDTAHEARMKDIAANETALATAVKDLSAKAASLKSLEDAHAEVISTLAKLSAKEASLKSVEAALWLALFIDTAHEARGRDLGVHNITMDMYEPRNGSSTGVASFEDGGASCAYITAIFGHYERTAKNISDQRCAKYAFTDRPDLPHDGTWKVITHPYHLDSKVDGYNRMHVGSPLFHIAKYYKTQFHRIPFMANYTVVIWLDGTVEITDQNASKVFGNAAMQNGGITAYERKNGILRGKTFLTRSWKRSMCIPDHRVSTQTRRCCSSTCGTCWRGFASSGGRTIRSIRFRVRYTPGQSVRSKRCCIPALIGGPFRRSARTWSKRSGRSRSTSRA